MWKLRFNLSVLTKDEPEVREREGQMQHKCYLEEDVKPRHSQGLAITGPVPVASHHTTVDMTQSRCQAPHASLAPEEPTLWAQKSTLIVKIHYLKNVT